MHRTAADASRTTNQTVCYVWNETYGGSGSDEMISLAHNYFVNFPTGAPHSEIWCDGCPGQLWNRFFMFWCVETCHPESKLYRVTNGESLFKRYDVYRNPVGHTFMLCDAVHGGVKRKLYGQDYVADLDSIATLVEEAQSDPTHIVRRLTSDILFDFKAYLGERYTITRSTMSEDVAEKVAIKKARWMNIGQGPCWKDPTGKTIISHPNEVWLRNTFDHTEKPRVVNVARWCSARGVEKHTMQDWLRQKQVARNPARLRAEERVAVSAAKMSDCHDSAEALPNIPVPAGKVVDEWGDPLPPHATLRDLYPIADAEDEASSESD